MMNINEMVMEMAAAGVAAERIAEVVAAIAATQQAAQQAAPQAAPAATAPVEASPVEAAPAAPARPGQAERVADWVANALKTHQVFTWEQAKEATGVRRTKRLIALMEEAIEGGSAVVCGANGRYAKVPGTEGHQAFLTHMGYPEDRIPKR